MAVATLVATAPATAAASSPETVNVAPGVTLTQFTVGAKDADDFWTVHVYLPATIDGPLNRAATGLGSREIADRVTAALREKGFEPRVEQVDLPAFADRPGGVLGWIVRVGRYASAAVDVRGVRGAEPQMGTERRAHLRWRGT
ncbi:hypothetical protein ETD86_27140 [Nonomuraea turkmeniaca]|uniref:Uncharacterized protein n=1 Tax=Nonomuraea turkmeniaca TaxID=103838 RepID=A0A5S4FWT1_9ACTN|nr:hypothetical protein [Nonomuraea turkmeniaca]TMR15456.1 hypothetical protein ETD86_27140 [Nonomuraea turkmeniaca]